MPDWMPVIQWFGYLPNFHDAEVLSIDLRRGPEPSVIRIDAWRTSNEVDADGYFKRDRRAVVRLYLAGVIQQQLSDWNHQNVLNKLTVSEAEGGWMLALEGTFGLDGYVVAQQISVEIEPQSAPA